MREILHIHNYLIAFISYAVLFIIFAGQTKGGIFVRVDDITEMRSYFLTYQHERMINYFKKLIES